MQVHSNYPMRSARLGAPRSYAFANNRLNIREGRGTYRMIVVSDQSAHSAHGVFFAVGRREAIDVFPVGTTELDAAGELLPVSGFLLIAAATPAHVGLSAVEVDVGDDEIIACMSLSGGEVVKIVKVGEFPSTDPMLGSR